MICLLKGNDLYLRARNWSAAEDFVWKCSIVNVNWWAENHYFNIETGYTCPNSAPDDSLDQLTQWKEAHDDICALPINDTYVAANHGMNCMEIVTAPEHGKTNDDIGSVWLDAENRTYCLVKIYQADKLGFVLFDDAAMEKGVFGYGKPQGKLIHKANALHQQDVIIAERSGGQLRPSFNHYSIRLLVDGKQVDPYTDLMQACSCASVETRYDVIYVPAMLRYLMENVGKNDNASMFAECIRERYVRVTLRYDFHENGSVTVCSSYAFQKAVDLDYIGLAQSMTVAEKPYAYVPDTAYDVLTQQDETQKFVFTRDVWRNAEKVPYRYYQFKDSTCAEGMAVVYDRNYGWGDNATRLACSKHAGYYNNTRKVYPSLVSGLKLEAGTDITGVAARIPISKGDPDLTAVCWYYIGEEIVLMLDTHKAVDKDVSLPDSLTGREMEIHDSSASCDLSKLTLDGNKLHICFDGYGYLVLRLKKGGNT